MFPGSPIGPPPPRRPARRLPAAARAGSPRNGRQGAGGPSPLAGGAPMRAALVLGCILVASLLAACQRVGPDFQKMSIQPKYDPLEPSDFFADGMAARPRVAGTVARSEVTEDGFVETGKVAGQIADGFPFPITAADINRGQERFNIYCSECHGRLADGNGMIPSRGFRRPPSFHTAML